ncbi:MAG: DUF58 domain-containing protein [Thermodesulfovibrionales bacterium]
MRRIKLTKEGRRFLLAGGLIGIASLNSGNNLIYLIFSMMISLGVVAVLGAVINLKRLACEISFREPLYANSPLSLTVTIENEKVFPSYSVSLEMPFDMTGDIYFPVMNRGSTEIRFEDLTISGRGKCEIRKIRLKTGFPFIFLYAYREIEHDKEIIVYPEITDVHEHLTNVEIRSSAKEAMVIGNEGEFFSIREYVYGEESRNIDWKASAKLQKTMVKEYSRKDERLATVILDNGATENDEVFERSVSIAASLCSELIDRGYIVRLITCRKVVPFGNGKAHLFKMLDILAELRQLDVFECQIGETIEGLSILIRSSDRSGFERISQLCSGVIDARDL